MTQRCLTPPTGPAHDTASTVRAALPVLETERLTLRAPLMSDFPHWRDLMVPDDEGFLGGPHTEEEAWEAFCVYAAGWMLHGHGLWTLELRATGKMIGFVIVGLEWGDEEPELGWMIDPQFRGRGFGFEAARAARDHGLTLFGSDGLVSYVASENDPANVLAERLGAKRDRNAEITLGDDQTHVWRYGDTA